MRRRLSRFLTSLAWWATPSDWVWFALGSFERGIYENLRRAEIDHHQLAEKLRIGWDRIEALKSEGTLRTANAKPLIPQTNAGGKEQEGGEL